MTHPQVTVGEEGLQMWRETGNYGISSRGHPTRDSPPAYGLGGLCGKFSSENLKRNGHLKYIGINSKIERFK
jgi:hypothetical protein